MSHETIGPNDDVFDRVCDIGVRAVWALREAGIVPDDRSEATPAQIARFRASDLLKLRNVGRCTVSKLRGILRSAGLDFAPEVETVSPPARSAVGRIADELKARWPGAEVAVTSRSLGGLARSIRVRASLHGQARMEWHAVVTGDADVATAVLSRMIGAHDGT